MDSFVDRPDGRPLSKTSLQICATETVGQSAISAGGLRRRWLDRGVSRRRAQHEAGAANRSLRARGLHSGAHRAIPHKDGLEWRSPTRAPYAAVWYCRVSRHFDSPDNGSHHDPDSTVAIAQAVRVGLPRRIGRLRFASA